MEIKTKERTIIVKDHYYVARDGKEFDSASACKGYEKSLDTKEVLKKLDKYMVPELENQIPLHDDASYSDYPTYTWFKVNSKEEFEDLTDMLKDGTGMPEPESYPAYLCYETENDFEGYAEDFSSSLEYCINGAKAFFDRFGFDVEFKRREG